MEEASNDSKIIVNEFEKQPRKLIDPCNVDTQSRQYWQEIFKIMDEYSAIPHHKRELDVVRTLEDPDLFLRLQQIYDIHTHDDIIDFANADRDTRIMPKLLETYNREDENDDYSESDEEVRVSRKHWSTLASRIHSSFFRPPPSTVQLESLGYIDYRKELTKPKADTDLSADSMYTNFLKKTPENACRWRPKPPVTLDGMNLQAKCDTITREITEDFVEWMNGLGGESSLDEAAIEGLFEIGFNCHAADSLKIHMQELNAVTEHIAYSRQTPELSYSTQLYRQLYRDKTAVKSKEANYAFGTMLPPEMRTGTTEESDVSKWLENKRVPEKLATMAAVWEGIEALKSTEGYCNWLLEHGDIPLPIHLVRKGFGDSQKKPEQSASLALITSNIQQSQSKMSLPSRKGSDNSTSKN